MTLKLPMPMLRRVLDGVGMLALPIVAMSFVRPINWTLLAIGAAVGVLLLVRVLRAGVECTPETITVRAYWWTRQIPTRSVLGIRRETPAIVWVDGSGQQQSTAMPAFKAFRTDIVAKDNRLALDRMQVWLEGQRTA